MRFRLFVTLLMATLSLLCPFFPCGECCAQCDERDSVLASDSVDTEIHCGSDSCCESHDERPAEGGSRSNRCPDGDKPLNCFCGGAVVTMQVECSDLLQADHDSPVFMIVVKPTSALNSQHLGCGCVAHSAHFPPLTTGREIRDLVSSYLL